MPNALGDLPKPELAPDSVPAPRKARRVKFALLVVLLAIAAAALWGYLHYRYQVSSDDAQGDGHITAIAPKIAGNVLDVLVNDNQPVKTGQVLVRIDQRDFQARVDMAKAALMQAESQLRSARVVVPWTNETTESGASNAAAHLADAQAEQIGR